jgi:acetylglutamate kinase
MEHNYSSPLVVKYGGNAMGEGGGLLPELVQLHLDGTPVVLVHGGGPEIDRWLAQRNVPTRRVDGLRVTDEATLEVTEAVLCATINKRLVRACAALGAKAVGISGEDADTLVAQTAHGSHGEDLGFVGDVTACDPSLINLLLAANYLPVIAPLAVAPDDAHAYNVNADLAAAAIAGAVRARAFVMITNVERVRRDPKDPSSSIDRLSLEEARAFVDTPACEGGMRPKMLAAISAVETGAAASYICGPQPIAAALAGNATIIALSSRA